MATQPEHERLFVTPHGLDLEALAGTAQAGYRRAESSGEVGRSVEQATEGGGVQLIEVPVDRASGLRFRSMIRGAVREALADL